ncbi:MAG: radical SAM protein [Bacteroidales bacterium]
MYNDFFSVVHPIEKQLHVEANRIEFASHYSEMLWISSDQAILLEQERDKLLKELLGRGGTPGYNNTKLDCQKLSPGCELCAQGQWSCLFVNNKCNATCFYCPAPQEELCEPSTETFTFSEVEDYIHYLELFGFKGCSLSGGEPFLSFDRSLLFVRRIREYFGDKMYIWMYTNGLLVTTEKLKELAEAGLDELRFDIGATSFQTRYLRVARGIIPRITVEIPAVPGCLEKLKPILHELDDLGLDHLNLHQLRCTPHNLPRLMNRGFVFMHGPKVLVAGSEVEAFRIMKYVQENGFRFKVNYCSFVYKNSHQNKAARMRGQEHFLQEGETITRAGFIKSMSLQEQPGVLEQIHVDLHRKYPSDTLKWRWQRGSDTLYFHPSLSEEMKEMSSKLYVSYFSTALRPSVSYRNPFRQIPFEGSQKIIIERNCIMRNFLLVNDQMPLFANLDHAECEQEFLVYLTDFAKTHNLPDEQVRHWIRIKEFEFMKTGFQPYY